jgi:hypothetical protein
MTIGKKILPWVFVALASVLLMPNLIYGIRSGHDIYFHTMLFMSYRDAVELGTLYPRWLPDQLHGLGSPALLIYPPLTSAFFVLIDSLTLHALTPDRLMGLGAVVLSIASAGTFYVWARQYAGTRLAFLVALFYATAPYHLHVDLYERGAMAEYAAFVWIPLIFLGIRSTILAGSAGGSALLTLGAGALFMTHLLTAMLIAPLALAYAVICLRMESLAGLRPSRLALLVFSAVLGVGLTAFYVLPALLLLPEANSAGLHRDIAASNIFTVFHQLVDRAASTNVSSAVHALTKKDKFSLKLLLLACAYIALFVYLMLETWRTWRRQGVLGTAGMLALMWIVSGVLCFTLMSGMFPFIFYPPSPYAQIQFGWRLLVVMEFSLLSLFVCSVSGTQHAASRTRLLTIGAMVSLSFIAYQCLYTVSRFRSEKISAHPVLDAGQVKLRLSPIEYFPIGTMPEQPVGDAIKPFEQYALAGQPAFIASDAGRLVKATREGAQFTVHAIVSKATPISIQQFYFPGWKAYDEHGGEITVFRDEASRLASYVAPAGEHTITIKRMPTKQERWGNVVSLVTLVLFVLHLGFLVRRRRISPLSFRFSGSMAQS